MTSKIVKSTSKGQITLPKSWRHRFKTDSFLLQMEIDYVTVKPVLLEELAGEEVLFDADRDNEGKGVSPDEIIRLLKKIQRK